jgi:hypothetical protein
MGPVQLEKFMFTVESSHVIGIRQKIKMKINFGAISNEPHEIFGVVSYTLQLERGMVSLAT